MYSITTRQTGGMPRTQKQRTREKISRHKAKRLPPSLPHFFFTKSPSEITFKSKLRADKKA
jgi:hypothetical protein